MSSTIICKVRLCLMPLKPVYNLGSSNFLTVCSSNLCSAAHFLCTKKTNPSVRPTDRKHSGQTEEHGRGKVRTIRHREEDLWNGAKEERSKNYTSMQRPYPKSVFAAGTAKRTAEIIKRKTALACEDEDQHVDEPSRRKGTGKLAPPDRPLSPTEWRTLKESVGNPQRFDVQMMSALFNSRANLDIPKSLLTFVAMETGTLSYELLLRYLTLCVNSGHDTEVFDLYDIMRGNFPCLETGALSLFIKSFSRTERWREGLNILQELDKVFTPSPRNYGDIISAAVLHGDTTTACTLYDELIDKGLSPHQETWEDLFRGARKTAQEGVEVMSQSEYEKKLMGILFYMRDNQIYPKKSLADCIKTWFESLPGQNWTGSWTSVNPKGLCRCCGSELESIQLTTQEYQQLKDRVMADIIEGQDVFKKSTPEELERFKAFVKRKPSFDVVMDGLNVANINKDKTKLSETLLAVVSEFARQGLAVLVLGRKHMLRPSKTWDRNDMALIQQKAHFFFTENISEDDPFLLYATLHSGNHCKFVSRDLMRDHKACLPDGASRRLFFKWQRGHQLVVDGHVAARRRVRFQSIPSYDTIVQTSEDLWHIPYDDSEDRSTYEVPQKWLCLSKVQ
ncbi:mitochondrial ribonuclease P catalytic subunit [Sphaeramia orbicularis]|uniref:Mitochondrial ribonuclease P catalytic subunit n=1 Tax=Sphaeramia orbicularis TaxID=375764 RepID=A0A673BXD9_9TELE|nr:mitochondrial ribonuclease P catalytic subunit [Sphaeramia orbicularis]